MHRPTEASRIGLLVMKTSCCFHHSNLTHAVRLNGMRLLLWVCPYQLFAVSAFRSVGKHIFTSIPQKMFLIDSESKPNVTIRIGRAAQTNQKNSDSFNLSFYRCLCSVVLCASENAQPPEFIPSGFAPVVISLSIKVCKNN